MKMRCYRLGFARTALAAFALAAAVPVFESCAWALLPAEPGAELPNFDKTRARGAKAGAGGEQARGQARLSGRLATAAVDFDPLLQIR